MTDLDRHQLAPLLERLLGGDRQALNDLFARLRPYLHAQVRKTLGVAARKRGTRGIKGFGGPRTWWGSSRYGSA